ncbi:MBL fold metallo-hydrolase [Desmonostoc muscorum LEGE 12446]|uniref:MBL fold metallo-hydrolase n=1 Tax=Desmonostoc muscorum LEGE 12446 TaxID=1828758 RepID=A0A8J6ZVP8_DESMC|nr:MBL fold metallo-hydrolase [Desmonostoc muscorum]MCF2148166.1 MBL fold metallo-hydrolase [Desmonostoc muscorum LEGE 12446]
MFLTWFDSNSWLLEIGGKRILIDPWLVGSLIFSNLEWLFKGWRSQERPIPENIDLILLSQGLEDHAHPPTLKQLDHNIKVVASPNAAKVVQQLGYTQVTTLAHGETFTLDNQIEIEAFPGSPIGPTLVENSYLIRELKSSLTLYYEPHGYHSPEVKQAAPIDVAITPFIDMTLPLLGPIIKGKNSALEVVKSLQPQVILPTAAGGDVIFEGLLMKLIQTKGSAAEFRSLLEKNNLSTRVIEPTPGDRFQLPLEKRALAI